MKATYGLTNDELPWVMLSALIITWSWMNNQDRRKVLDYARSVYFARRTETPSPATYTPQVRRQDRPGNTFRPVTPTQRQLVPDSVAPFPADLQLMVKGLERFLAESPGVGVRS